jgi:hypothetical protein
LSVKSVRPRATASAAINRSLAPISPSDSLKGGADLPVDAIGRSFESEPVDDCLHLRRELLRSPSHDAVSQLRRNNNADTDLLRRKQTRRT